MRTTFLSLVVLLVVPHVDAAPVPDPGRLPKERLEKLKKRLPDILDEWMKKEEYRPNWAGSDWIIKPEVRLLRRVGHERAKAVILFVATDKQNNRRAWRMDVLLTVFLSYEDGYWTTERFETDCFQIDMRPFHATFAFLMMAIDEAAEK